MESFLLARCRSPLLPLWFPSGGSSGVAMLGESRFGGERQTRCQGERERTSVAPCLSFFLSRYLFVLAYPSPCIHHHSGLHRSPYRSQADTRTEKQTNKQNLYFTLCDPSPHIFKEKSRASSQLNNENGWAKQLQPNWTPLGSHYKQGMVYSIRW